MRVATNRNLIYFSLSAAFALYAGPAHAETIIQTAWSDDPFIEGGFAGFDTSLGTLNDVTLSVTTVETREIIELGPNPVPETITWSVNGNDTVVVINRTLGLMLGSLQEPIAGSGTLTDSLGSVIELSGTATFNLDPSFFTTLTANPLGGVDYQAREADQGMYQANDITFTTDGNNVVQYLGCWLGPQEWCDNTHYTITYDYTPADAAVPEPSSWALMLLGFGAMGLALRRRAARRNWRADGRCTNGSEPALRP